MVVKALFNGLGSLANLTRIRKNKRIAIIVDVRADYIEVQSPERTVDLIIDPELGELMDTGLEAPVPGGTGLQPVLAKRSIQEPLTGLHAKRLRFLAVIKIKHMPRPGVTPFTLILKGAARKTIMGLPFSTTYFCGTTLIVGTTSYKLIPIPEAPGNYRLVATVTWDSSTPAGNSSATWDYDVAGIGLQEARDKYDGKSFSFSGSSTSAWYQDTVTGIYHDAQLECIDIPLPGDPQPSTVFEGFKSITVQVIASKGMKVRNPLEWDGDTSIDEILIPDPEKPNFDGRRLSRTIIGRIFAGKDEANLPYYDDLPNGAYNFNLEKNTFKNIPYPPPSTQAFKQIIAWPNLASVPCRYRLAPIQGPKPDYLDYFMPENLNDPGDYDKKIPSGFPPPSNQVFST